MVEPNYIQIGCAPFTYDGIEFYGVWPDGEIPQWSASLFPSFLLSEKVEFKTDRFSGGEYSGVWVDVRVLEWPDRQTWGDAVRSMLAHIVACGAVASWCGGELCSPHPAIIDLPLCTYAAYCLEAGFVGDTCPRTIQDLKYLSADDLAPIQRCIDSKVVYTRD